MDKPTSTDGVTSITRGLRTMRLKWPDGEPIKAGDLKPGHEYKFNAFTGVMVMSDKKIGPREQQLREIREKRVEENKRKIDNSVRKVKGKALGTKVVSFKASKRGGRGR